MASDRNHPFFRPKWRRVAAVAMCVLWTVLEWNAGQAVWGTIALAVTGYAVWTLLISYDEAAGTDAG